MALLYPHSTESTSDHLHLPSFGHCELEARDQRAAQRRGRDLAGVDWGVSRQQTHGEAGDDATQQHHRHVDGLSKTMQLETPSAQNLAGAG